MSPYQSCQNTARTDSFHILHTLGRCCFQLGIMALGFVRSTVELLTYGRGITPVRGFHQLTCPLLYRLALMLVFGLCVWKWTSSVTTLDGSASGIAQSLACTRKLGKCRRSEGLRSFNPSKGTNLLILIILAGDIEMNPGPNVVFAKYIARHQKNRLNVKNAKSAFTHHASTLTKRNCWNKNREMDLGIAPTAKLIVVYVVVLFYMVTKQSNVTNVKCGFTINAPSSQNLNLIL